MAFQEKPHSQKEPLGLYLHVPFCASTCDFCAFYQEAPERAELDRFLDTIEKEWTLRPPPRSPETVFWGGGTPGLLPARDLDCLAAGVRGICDEAPAEWSVELAPSVVRPEKVETLLSHGVNRLSLGVQSFDAGTLERLGRRHAPTKALQAIETIRAAGCRNLNLDLIFGVPGQTVDQWRGDLEAALDQEPEHISTYCLTFEEDTALWVKARQGAVRPQSEEEEAAFYETTWEVLANAGFEQYEVSNFARPGFACRHNLNTWKMYSWIGYGPSAASQEGGWRYNNPADLDQWRQGIESDVPDRVETTPLSDDLLACDALIFGLRMNAGVSLADLEGRFPSVQLHRLEPLWRRLEENTHLHRLEAGRIALTPSGRLLADRIGAEILERFDEIATVASA